MTAQGEMTIQEIARSVSRDVKAVHGYVQASWSRGVLGRTEGRHVTFSMTRCMWTSTCARSA